MRVLETVALAIWVGAMVAFAFIFAPIAFHTIADLDTFARLIGQTITMVTYVGFACAALILIAIARSGPSRTRRIRLTCIALMLISSVYELTAVIPAMQQILVHAGGSIAALSTHDPRRLAYDAQHRSSSMVYGVTLVAGLVALILRSFDTTDAIAARLTPARESEISLS